MNELTGATPSFVAAMMTQRPPGTGVQIMEGIGRVNIYLKGGKSFAKHSMLTVKDANDMDALKNALDQHFQQSCEREHRERVQRE